LRALVELVQEAYPALDADEAIRAGIVRVGGRIVTNPASLVRGDAPLGVQQEGGPALRGEAKLEAALGTFAVPVRGRVALDVGAAAGGFTRVLLANGAVRVYAVDAGYGQLLGSLRQHPAVVNLERTNLAELSRALVPETIELVTADLSYISLARALPQLEGRVDLAADADLLAVVKPQFELALPESPRSPRQLSEALERARAGATRAGWRTVGATESPIRGSRGSVEFLLHARRRSA
jgi:23S rRNA (cytidine1920-2'-O)/16S rRNA (cytidine1409-2'-O)-methyltransferase